MENAFEVKLQQFNDAHTRFQVRNTARMRSELSERILRMDCPEERRSYLLYLLSYAHSPEELTDLAAQVNEILMCLSESLPLE